MRTTRVFKSGNSQAVRLPIDFQVSTGEVEIFKKNNDIIIREKPPNLSRAFDLLTAFPEDFFDSGREDDFPQERNF